MALEWKRIILMVSLVEEKHHYACAWTWTWTLMISPLTFRKFPSQAYPIYIKLLCHCHSHKAVPELIVETINETHHVSSYMYMYMSRWAVAPALVLCAADKKSFFFRTFSFDSSAPAVLSWSQFLNKWDSKYVYSNNIHISMFLSDHMITCIFFSFWTFSSSAPPGQWPQSYHYSFL